MSMDNSLYIQRYNSCLEVLLSDLPKFFVSQWLTVSMIIQNILYGKFCESDMLSSKGEF